MCTFLSNKGFSLQPSFARTFSADMPVFPGASLQVKLLLDKEAFDARIERSDNWKKYTVAYEPDTAIAEKLSEFMTPPPEMGFCGFQAPVK